MALRLDTDAVIHSSTNPLFAAEIALGCLHGNMPKQELNLLQLSSCRVAQLCARAPQVMRRETGKADFGGVRFHYVAHYSLRHAITPALPSPADATKYFPSMKLGCTNPLV
jgi:hypothetical protein